MKSKKNGDSATTTEPTKDPMIPIPEGYEEQSSSDDLAGFWDSKRGPIHFVPLHVKAFDSHIEPLKPSIIVIGRAIGQVPIVESEGGKESDSEDGDQIGVWYKPGMALLKKFADVAVFMYQSGELDTGKRSKMKTFSISVKKGAVGNTLYLADDYRKKSAHTTLPFEKKARRRAGPAEDTDEDFNRPMQAGNSSRGYQEEVPNEVPFDV